MSLHVVQLGPYPPPEGGISRNILAIRDELLKDGHRCSIIATSQSSRISDEPDVYHPRSSVALLRLLRHLNFDVLHLHAGGHITVRVLALAFACSVIARNKSVLTIHSGGFAAAQKARGIRSKSRSLAAKVFRRFARLIAINDSLSELFQQYGVAGECISVIPPYALQEPDAGVSVPATLQMFFEKHEPVLLAVGGLEQDYQPLFLIETMKSILEQHPNAGLMIVGGGSMRDEADVAIAATGYRDSIFLCGDVEHSVTLHLINNADIVLRTTLFDGDAISVREALFLGTPVIATENGSRPAGVHTIEISDREALVRKINEVSSAKIPASFAASAGNSNVAEVVKIYSDLSTSK